MLKELFSDYINDSIRKNWSINALSDYKGESFTYAEIASHIAAIHKLYKSVGVEQGDKVALIGRNSARWCIVYLATVDYGAAIVPILPDFKPNDMQDIINHSDATILFCADNIYQNFAQDGLEKIKLSVSVTTFEFIQGNDREFEKLVVESKIANPDIIQKQDFTPPSIANDQLAVISYTSGTTGHSKGVMLNHNSLAANIRFAQNNMPLNPGDAIVSFLPLAHAYGCAFEFLFPFTIGCTITILTKTPSPQIVMQAFGEIKPALILSVPLVIEKIYKKQLLPIIDKPLMKLLINTPLLNNIILAKIRKKLVNVFGGNFTEIVIGGAAFNPEAEAFFQKMKFPFTIGYGMTECGPLISYASWKITRLGCSGKPVDTLEVKVDSKNPTKEVGEVLVRGDNVMLGYYKNDEATREIIDKDGWMHTGDLGLIDDDGFVYLKGRSKSLILGSSGKNIYPEEIESGLNNLLGVSESVVVQRDQKLVALIHADEEALKAQDIQGEQIEELMKNHIKEVNALHPKYMQVANYELVETEFEKTPKRSIKRFLYQ